MVRAALRLPREAQTRTSVSKFISVFGGPFLSDTGFTGERAVLAQGADPGSGIRQIVAVIP